MQQAQRCLIIAVDLGTSATTAQWALAVDSFNRQGELQRGFIGSPVEMRAWRGARKGDAIGNICLPTDLVYDRASKELLCMGFQAQQYLDDPSPEIAREKVFVVEHIKLLLTDPDNIKVSPETAARHRKMRDELVQTLQKGPYEVFVDFLDAVIEEIIGAAKMSIRISLETSKLELALAFPSGWPELVHRKVAAIGARSVQKALEIHNLQTMTFGIQNVYTLSETLCGVKEWLTATIEEASLSLDLGPQTSNLDELNEGDLFLPVDIGGGTGCLTPLKLVSKSPLKVDQLGPTQSLQVSGEAVEAEFEKRLRQMVSPNDYRGDVERLFYQICREFKEEKKNCGQPPRPGSSTWNIPAPRLRANPRKGFEKDCMRISRTLLEQCFDPVLDRLDVAIDQVLAKYPTIKAIVFLGQFGGSSDYLRKRMARSSIANSVKLRHSLSGKLDVVKGAMSDRLKLTEKFIRKSETVKSYGTLITLRYDPGSEGQRMFPNAIQDGAVPLERHYDTDMVKVVEWAIPKATTLEENLVDIGKDGRRYHTWPFNETDLEFEDIIVVSDEVPPPPWEDGRSYTLWTTAHQENNLVINGRRLEVHQIPYVWGLAMSVKLDAHSNVIGSYETDDLSWFMWPEEKKKHKRRVKRRFLKYELVWNITEMQVKTFVRAIFPNPTGALTMQLAKERPLGPQELIYGESRSQSLVKDIQVSAREAAHAAPVARPRQLTENGRNREQTVEQDQRLDDILGSSGRQLVNDLANEYQQPGAEVAQMTDHVQTARPVAQMTSDRQIPPPARTAEPLGIPGPSLSAPRDGPGRQDETTEVMPRSPLQPAQTSSSNLKMDGRRRDGCYTCKLRKKKCDCSYTFIGTTNSQTCHTCNRHGITCHMTDPEWVDDPDRVRAHRDEQKRLLRLKRKSRDNSVSSGRTSRDRSATVRPTESSMHQNSVLHSIENGFLDHHPGSINGPSAPPRKGMAVRGGKGGFRRPRQ